MTSVSLVSNIRVRVVGSLRTLFSGSPSSRFTLLLAVLACTASADAGAPQTRVEAAALKVKSWFQIGEASWYGRAVQGHSTASGERFDMNAMTCAHRTLPLGSWLKVTNLANRRSVLVRVTDRGPVSRDRVIDLSYAAAHAVGIGGVSSVKLETLNPSDPTIMTMIAVRIAAGMAAPRFSLGVR